MNKNNFINVTQIDYQKWYGFLGYRIKRKKSTTSETTLGASKIISFKEVIPKLSLQIYKDFPTYTHIRIIGSRLGLDVVK